MKQDNVLIDCAIQYLMDGHLRARYQVAVVNFSGRWAQILSFFAHVLWRSTPGIKGKVEGIRASA